MGLGLKTVDDHIAVLRDTISALEPVTVAP
jgi:hypothetical protein